MKTRKPGPGYVPGPLGEHLTAADLPPPDTRWVPRRKAVIVIAIDNGILSVQEACRRYSLSLEELTGWRITYAAKGLAGLSVFHRASATADVPQPPVDRPAPFNGSGRPHAAV